MTPDPPAGPPTGPAGDTPPAAPAPPPRRPLERPDPAVSTWGFGEVGIGFLLSQVLVQLVAVGVFAAAGWTDSEDVPLWGLFLLQVPLWAGYLAVVVYAGRGKGRGVVADFGVGMRWYDAPLGLVTGVAMQLVVLPLVYLPLLNLLDIDPDELSAPARDLTDRAGGAAGWVLLTLMVVAAAPVVEELFFRGLLLRSAQKRGWSDPVAVVVSASVFGAVHFQPLQFLGLFLLGLVLAAATVRTGRLGPAIWTHVGFNATTILTLYVTAT